MHIYIGSAGSSLLCVDFLKLWRTGAPLHCGAQASHCSGFSRCGAQALGHEGFSSWGSRAWAQYSWRMGLVASKPMGSCQTRDWICIGRQILNHWKSPQNYILRALHTCQWVATLEVSLDFFKNSSSQRVVPRLAVSASPRNLWDTQIFRLLLRPTKSEIL